MDVVPNNYHPHPDSNPSSDEEKPNVPIRNYTCSWIFHPLMPANTFMVQNTSSA